MSGRRGGTKAVTLADVAAVAGVSVSAVSMALADHPRIGTRTKAQIHALADELGYVSNSAARSLRSQRSGTIALDRAQHGPARVRPPVLHAAAGGSQRGAQRTRRLAAGLDQSGRAARSGCVRAGACVAGPRTGRSSPRRRSTTSTCCGWSTPGCRWCWSATTRRSPDAVSVASTDVEGARAATDHLRRAHGLAEHGAHQRTAEPPDLHRPAGRLSGRARPASRRAKALVVAGDFGEESGRPRDRRAARPAYRTCRRSSPRNDEMAYGALLELQGARRWVPQDIALVGYDDFGCRPADHTCTDHGVGTRRRGRPSRRRRGCST